MTELDDIPLLDADAIETINKEFLNTQFHEVEVGGKVESKLLAYKDYTLQLEINVQPTSKLDFTKFNAAYWAYFWVASFVFFSSIKKTLHYKVHFKSQLWGDVNFEGEIPKDLGNADIDLLSVPKNSFLKQITGSKIDYKEFMRLIENHHWQGTSMIFDIQATHGMTLQVAEKCYVEYNV